MNPVSTLRFRRATGWLAAGWALLAVGLSIFALVTPAEDLALPLRCTFITGVATVQSVSAEAAEAGISVGNRLISIDGVPTLRRMRWGGGALRAGEPNIYEVEQRSGEVRRVSLAPISSASAEEPFVELIHTVLLLVAIFYMAIGSQANVGGAASAPVVASAFHPTLAPVGVLLAVLGYALGTYAAWFCGILMQAVSP